MKSRKSNRLTGFNYSSDGAYFVTICTKNRECLLSQIVGRGDLDAPEIIILPHGEVVIDNIIKMNDIYKNIKTKKYVIMPNHIHMLISIKGFENGASRSPLPTNSILSRYIAVFKRYCNKEIGGNFWQNSFYDHIIRDENDYIKHLEYIENNPAKWLLGKDEYYANNENG